MATFLTSEFQIYRGFFPSMRGKILKMKTPSCISVSCSMLQLPKCLEMVEPTPCRQTMPYLHLLMCVSFLSSLHLSAAHFPLSCQIYLRLHQFFRAHLYKHWSQHPILQALISSCWVTSKELLIHFIYPTKALRTRSERRLKPEFCTIIHQVRLQSLPWLSRSTL